LPTRIEGTVLNRNVDALRRWVTRKPVPCGFNPHWIDEGLIGEVKK